MKYLKPFPREINLFECLCLEMGRTKADHFTKIKKIKLDSRNYLPSDSIMDGNIFQRRLNLEKHAFE